MLRHALDAGGGPKADPGFCAAKYRIFGCSCGSRIRHCLLLPDLRIYAAKRFEGGGLLFCQYQASVGADGAYLKIPTVGASANPGGKKFNVLKKSMFQDILKDEGFFSAIDPMKRIMVAENTYDLGEYLVGLHRAGELDTTFGEVSGRMVY